MKTRIALLATIALLAACSRVQHPEAVRVRPDSATIDLELARSVVDEIVPRVARLRGLEFREPVEVAVVDDAAAREQFIEQFERFDLADGFEVSTRAYRLLGLLDERPAMEVLLAALEDQAGGFYDPATGTYYLLDDMPAAAVEMLTAHELVHALEDQHFDLTARILDRVESDDASFAVRAVHEGSATLIMTAYMLEAIGEGRLGPNELSAAVEAQGEPAPLPEVLSRQLIGPYVLGASFLTGGDPMAAASGGFDGERVARAFDAGPLSSEQVLHPEKFWDPEQRDDPVAVAIPDLAPLLGADWQRLGAGDLGELVLAIVAEPGATVSMTSISTSGWTNEAAAGWGGDRWELWSAGDRDLLVARIVWDSEADAEQFGAALAGREGFTVAVEGRTLALVVGELPAAGDRLVARLLRG